MVAEGDLIGDRYRVKERLGSGGMGTVYLAVDERLQRKVALKLLDERRSQAPGSTERFQREARLAASLAHPNIANVFDYGEGEHRYITMEYVEGSDLATVIAEDGPLDPARVLIIAEQIAAALAHAHAEGLVHRDIKPANVILGYADRVKVTDFGIARGPTDATLTATGTVLGTSLYLSPEQAAARPVGPQSDVYSLGIVIYEMLTGSPPFTGGSAVSIAMQHLNDEVPPPSASRADVPKHLDDVVAAATAKDPDARPADGKALRILLRQPADSAPGAVPTGGVITGRWDPQKVGRGVLLTFMALAALVVTLALVRVAQGPPPAGAPGEPAAFVLPDEIIGSQADTWVNRLERRDLTVETKDVADDAEPGTVVRTDPTPGATVEPGGTVTLAVSAGPEESEPPSAEDDEDDDDDGEEDDAPPGKGKGKAKGKDKKEKD